MDKSIKLAKLVKHLWLEAYDEVAGVHFTRAYVPKIIHLIGSPAYENNGSMLLGTAEGGMKVTLYMVNSLQMEADFLNYFYFKTMHHEFTHILNQQKNYDIDFEKISEENYVQGNWSQISDEYAASAGFVSPYACSEPREDFAEVLSTYVTNTQKDWDALLEYAGTNGAAIINQKFEMVKNYMKNSWEIDLTELRDVVQRRSGEIELLDLDNL
jgi:substrate import-associated zinc metallohydrolase lipoprotein